MPTDDIKKILTETDEKEIRERFREAGLNYDKIKKGAEQADYIHEKKGVYDEPKPLPESYKNPRR
ncbi:MAG TPA: hypothetical protein P5323_04075 [Candidatus Moranbacteria bacterium]|jgi:hypothetical protein|nr:hypothetical protein [Candidatus Moranbacteria bacterium]HRY28287.1 hypothetical protein [Candidatus Moranbacteria bacterium]HSA08059.1 hypothetical protein [Candidatus Moranbacteria bacterium]